MLLKKFHENRDTLMQIGLEVIECGKAPGLKPGCRKLDLNRVVDCGPLEPTDKEKPDEND